MKAILKLICIMALMLSFGCNSNKKITSLTYISKSTISANEFVKEGYVEGVVLTGSKNRSKCSCVIKLLDSNEMLDPLNIKDFPISIDTNEVNVWLKYNSLRMQNRCNTARPIKILEIKKSEG